MIVELPAELVLARAREVRERLLQALASGEALELDPSRVESADVAGLQLLCGLHKSAFAKNTPLTVRESADVAAMNAIAVRAGFRRHQGCTTGCLWVSKNP